ncbi:MAG: hypothetical protein GF364_19790 [Candidatus Lokiarchaeota archaeon]|nr:hypothetical protein [Candidatus Lokiarchaeota archaeon]
MACNVITNFKNANIQKKPGHDVILKNILIQDENAIATEVPVWCDSPEKLTGHIDLIRIKENILEVIDYKPEGNFMRSLPQVACYGLLLKQRFNIDNIVCLSFNDKNIWEYEPEVVLQRINEILSKIKADSFKWQIYT